MEASNLKAAFESQWHVEELLRPTQFDWAEGADTDSSSIEDPAHESLFLVAHDDDGSDDTYSDSGSSLFNTLVSSECAADVRAGVREEFSFRRHCMELNHHDPSKIHHFNWLGCPVYEYSATHPAISLLFLTSPPKTSFFSDEWRIRAILAAAIKFVDPVVVYLDQRRGRKDLARRGSDLVRFATGRVYKFYSEHGHWVDDNLNWDDNSAIDVGNIHVYESPYTAISNGFVHHNTIRSRAQWMQESEEKYQAFQATNRKKVFSKLHRKQKSPSPLRFSVTSDDSICQVPYNSVDENERNAVESPASDYFPLSPRKQSFTSNLGVIKEEEEVSDDEVSRPVLVELAQQPSSLPAYSEGHDLILPSSSKNSVVLKTETETIVDDEQPLIDTSCREIGKQRSKKRPTSSFATAASQVFKYINEKCKSATSRVQREVYRPYQRMQEMRGGRLKKLSKRQWLPLSRGAKDHGNRHRVRFPVS